MIDLEPDDIDRLWREGLAHAPATPVADATTRVEAKITRRQRARRARSSIACLIAVVVVIGAVATLRRTSTVTVGTSGPITKLTVEDGVDNTLSIGFPNRQTVGFGNSIALPAGRVRFRIVYHGAHALVLDGVTDFDQPRHHAHPTVVVKTVYLRPGRYFLHCVIPGHTQAGEAARLIVR